MGEARIGVDYSGLYTENCYDVVDRPRRHHPVTIAEKDRPGFPAANENEQITEVFVVDKRNDPCFAAFALAYGHPLALRIEVPNVEVNEFTATNAEPPECFDQTSIPKIVGAQE